MHERFEFFVYKKLLILFFAFKFKVSREKKAKWDRVESGDEIEEHQTKNDGGDNKEESEECETITISDGAERGEVKEHESKKDGGETEEEAERVLTEGDGRIAKKRKLAAFACPCCKTPTYLVTKIMNGDVILSLESEIEYHSY